MHTPILFLIFNRPDLASKVFAKIRKARPKKLYIAADGPRTDEKYHDRMRCLLTRDAVLKNIDWDCDVKTLLRDDNLGCGLAVREAINWFFKHEEEGIILEDDCLPDDTFFDYCTAMLKQYRDDPRVMQVQGFSMVVQDLLVNKSKNNTIHTTCVPNIWGWATWRRAWDRYHYDMQDIELDEFIASKPFSDHLMEHFLGVVDKFKDPETRPDLWDLQWCTSIMAHGSYSVYPALSLIENIGFSVGTHTTNGNFWFENRPTIPIDMSKVTVDDEPENMLNEIYDDHVLEIVIMQRKIPAGRSRWRSVKSKINNRQNSEI